MGTALNHVLMQFDALCFTKSWHEVKQSHMHQYW